jgi:hypothetical protein
MKDLILKKSPTTPLVHFNATKGILNLEGRSIPEDPGLFFNVLMDWVKEYFLNPQELTKIEINLEYVNSGSSKYLLAMLHLVQEYFITGHNCVIDWYYEEDDESLLELGEHFKNSIKIPFNMIETYE